MYASEAGSEATAAQYLLAPVAETATNLWLPGGAKNEGSWARRQRRWQRRRRRRWTM